MVSKLKSFWLEYLPTLWKDLRPDEVPFKTWMGIGMIWRYVRFISLLIDNKYLSPKGQWRLLYPLVPLIQSTWSKSGITFAIKYWSEVFRLVICFVDPHNKTVYDTKTWVGRVKKKGSPFNGLPKVLPNKVKSLCCETKEGIRNGSLPRIVLVKFKLLLSVLAFFRATSPKFSEPKFETITSPFGGQCEYLPEEEIKVALRNLKIDNFREKKPSIFHFTTKAGPNAPLAVLGLGFDLLGWMVRPRKWWSYCLMCYTRGYWSCLIFFVLSSLLLVPVLPIILGNDAYPLLGRIAILEEARGKRRLIGITDWWTQVLFLPLHDLVYSKLNLLDEDGTRDQQRVIKIFLEKLGAKSLSGEKGKRCQSMDLSAATDRLPVKLQAQILEILGYPGNLWMSLLDRQWLMDGRFVKYSVGQPMGAYSSFAMLALTHHVIVQCAAQRAKVPNSSLIYMILGDDGAMANKKVARYYKEIFLSLGMEINPIKGFEGTVLEFAKQIWTANGYNLSPIGAKNIFLAMRFIEFLPGVLYELFVKGMPLFLAAKKNLLDVQSKIAEQKLIQAIEFVKSQGSNAGNYTYNMETGSLKSRGVHSHLNVYDGKPYTPMTSQVPLVDANPRLGTKIWNPTPAEELKREMADQGHIPRKVFKRTADGHHNRPLINGDSLYQLISRTFFHSGKKGKLASWASLSPSERLERIDISIKIKLRVLMSIGPRSGLWFLSPRVIASYHGYNVANLYTRLFFQALYTWFYKYDKISYIKFTDQTILRLKTVSYSKIRVGSKLSLAWSDFIDWINVAIRLPLTFVPDYGQESLRIPPIFNRISPFVIIGLPSLVVITEGLKALVKVIRQSFVMVKFYTWNFLFLSHRDGLLIGLLILPAQGILLSGDPQPWLYLIVLILALHGIVRSDRAGAVIKHFTYFNALYGMPGENVIWDKFTKVFDPFDGSISTLVKLSSDTKIEDSGAYLQIISLLKRRKPVMAYLERLKAAKVKTKSTRSKRIVVINIVETTNGNPR